MCKKVLENVPDDFPPRPFCGARCKLVDLHNWLGETYRISSPADVSAADSDADDGGRGES
jgi:endogenous inhibitor of DNA gyrase (YacG/DUF329 family)